MRHAAIGGGKRLRPLLVFATASLFGVDRTAIARVATALECIHVYSLIHDDLPAMDDDDMRRGKPTVHKAFDEATAILAGDCLHALAFEILADDATHADPFVRAELVADARPCLGPVGHGRRADDGPRGRESELRSADGDPAAGDEDRRADRPARSKRRDPRPRAARRPHRAARLCPRRRPRLPDRRRHARRRRRRGAAGKKLRKDDAAGKETFVSLLGLDRARAQAPAAGRPGDRASQTYGPEADLLRAIARFALERDR